MIEKRLLEQNSGEFQNKVLTTFSRYGTMGTARLVLDLLYTKLYFRSGARIVRRPIYIRGFKNMQIAPGFTTGVGVRLDAFSNGSATVIRIGRDVQVNDYVHIAALKCIEIGEGSLIASRVFIADHNHGEYGVVGRSSDPSTPPADRPLISAPVKIGRNVWLGEQVCILPGVSIGDGSIIGAGSIVSRSIPSECIAVGNPARIIKRYNRTQSQWENNAK